jgi:hypothetical protein
MLSMNISRIGASAPGTANPAHAMRGRSLVWHLSMQQQPRTTHKTLSRALPHSLLR